MGRQKQQTLPAITEVKDTVVGWSKQAEGSKGNSLEFRAGINIYTVRLKS